MLTEVTERPFDVLGSGGTRLRDALRAERGRLDPVSATVLARLSDCAHDWSAAEVPGLTGLDAGACLQAVRALVERGLVRPAGPAGDRPRFRVLHLLAAVDAVRQTAAVA
ncbi:hypothetical protein ACFQZC_26705 [Streptacidiphilus monticola]